MNLLHQIEAAKEKKLAFLDIKQPWLIQHKQVFRVGIR
jgi:hypothetical protein